MPRIGGRAESELSATDRDFLYSIQVQALRYFLDNQTAHGLVLDRQSNHGQRRAEGLCSLAATGMGCIGIALAAEREYGLISRAEAGQRISAVLQTCLRELPADHGVLPHFVDSTTLAVRGDDAHSTIETAWIVAGSLCAASSLGDRELIDVAKTLYERVNWAQWTRRDGLIRHGKNSSGHYLPCAWDRLNGETVFMYTLAAGASDECAIAPEAWHALEPFHGSVAGLRYISADLGLFVFQYGLDLLDLRAWKSPGPLDVWAEAAVAVEANLLACRAAAEKFATYRRFWGLSAGDGPGFGASTDIYREYSPAGLMDGTAHLTATLASIAHRPGDVLDNLREAEFDTSLEARGRYGFSNINLDARWIGRDMVGIDAGAAVLALDNLLHDNRIRRLFHGLPCIERAVSRLGFLPVSATKQAA
jgi:hypothetical protein